MENSLKITGAPSLEELHKSPAYPDRDRLYKGPIAIIECIEEIPCNPCEAACSNGAITIGESITNLPKMDFEKCVACGRCIPACPGLAIYIKDYTYSDTKALLSFPYEYYPLPEVNDIVEAVDRHGNTLCQAKVIKVRNPKSNDHTAVVTIEYPKEYFEEVISIKRIK
ncbi:MAG TPA: 4Fe-4S binding protein [Sedimentibacter sp.]|nr:4Fe-4S binding protein [Sedimentibacter sp.]HOK49980.1 4Fe-4S binding protein [Sedimentibacter sp.]HOW22665.1 4Fe-4S binding protein [Sedimentibacter sp.]HRC80544.1 4Fe-4S binding protein [Sedimentibacter sp.]